MKETIAVQLYSLAQLCLLYDCYVSIYITISSVLFRSRKRGEKNQLQLHFLFVEMHLIAGVEGVFTKFNFFNNIQFSHHSYAMTKGLQWVPFTDNGIVGLTSSCHY